ncbi:hypothetical protein [Streptomyces sp. NPDC047453]|uniref:hypothetical protein n=1 Tax=Streptomyces sp. NPDC047453 TaxID=3154812 RepID=UPI0033E65D7A
MGVRPRGDRQVKDNEAEMREAIAATRTTLTTLPGLDTVLAAKVLGHIGDLAVGATLRMAWQADRRALLAVAVSEIGQGIAAAASLLAINAVMHAR